MNRIARYIKMIMLIVIAVVGLTGCEDLTKPKSEFYGFVKNTSQYRLFITDPSDATKVWTRDPGAGFYALVNGSSVIHIEARLEDGTLYSSLNQRINQISKDAQVNNVDVDWCWTTDGNFQP